jgi:hypothetical protein
VTRRLKAARDLGSSRPGNGESSSVTIFTDPEADGYIALIQASSARNGNPAK